ncbi:hypothetical protein, partial [Shigella sonnei]|uniref:hypothetical protein n=1 Tax=Shigella sonnei TaxID=624 RepID=UPI00149418CD
TGGTADRNRSHWSTSKTPSYTKSVSWQHHRSIDTPESAKACTIIAVSLSMKICNSYSFIFKISFLPDLLNRSVTS